MFVKGKLKGTLKKHSQGSKTCAKTQWLVPLKKVLN